MDEPSINEHGVEASAPNIFAWSEIDAVRFDDGTRGQIVSGANMHLIRAVYPPGSVYEMHSHPYEQFSLLLAGRIRLTVGEETREVQAGDAWFAPPDVPHGGEILGDDDAVFIDVYAPATTYILDLFATATPMPAGELD